VHVYSVAGLPFQCGPRPTSSRQGNRTKRLCGSNEPQIACFSGIWGPNALPVVATNLD